jgi:hypothetical protein
VRPPTATTFGEILGQLVSAELPDDAKKTTPGFWKCDSREVSVEKYLFAAILEIGVKS